VESAFVESVIGWRDFFGAVAGASATLVGLLFVALALNPAIMADDGPAGLRAWTGQTFHSFLTLLILALVVLIPDPSPTTLGISLLFISGQGMLRVVKDFRGARADPDPEWHGRSGFQTFGYPIGAYIICLWVSIEVWRGDPDMMGWLVAVVFLLVISASISCWELLKTIGDRHKLERAGMKLGSVAGAEEPTTPAEQTP
jgi:hypothetical protein